MSKPHAHIYFSTEDYRTRVKAMIKVYGIIQNDFHQSYQYHSTLGLVLLEGTTK